jgi:eukaryotic-like serine/threonine-protein kinase
MERASSSSSHRVVGRYAVCDEIASGGMATVYFGRLLGPAGFARTVAIKCLHPQFSKDSNFVSMFLDEARLAARIRHPNVVPILDVVTARDELFLVMEYVHGESLAKLIRTVASSGSFVPPPIAAGILVGLLHGLQAAHDARDEAGRKLGIVHRDVSPQNVLVGSDGLPRVTDFGVAKATGRLQSTVDGQLKGKLNYTAPEQFMAEDIDQRVDVYAASVVLWETLTGARLFDAERPGTVMHAIISGEIDPPGSRVAAIPAEIDAIVMKGLSRKPDKRFATAREMANALEAALRIAAPSEIGEWVERVARKSLAKRAALMARMEADLGSPASMRFLASTGSTPSRRSNDSKEITAVAELGTGASITAQPTVASTPEAISSPPSLDVTMGAPVTEVSVATPVLRRIVRRSRSWKWRAAIGGALLFATLLVVGLRALPSAHMQAAVSSPIGSLLVPLASPQTDSTAGSAPTPAVGTAAAVVPDSVASSQPRDAGRGNRAPGTKISPPTTKVVEPPCKVETKWDPVEQIWKVRQCPRK